MADSSRWFRRRPQLVAAPEFATAPAVQVVPAAVDEPVTPAGPRGERTKTVAVRLSPEEHAVWAAAAAEAGRGQMGRWVRETVTARLDNRPVTAPAECSSQVREIRAELARIGSNLNQIAKALNIVAKGGGPAPEAGEIARNLTAARELLGSVRDELRGQ